MIKKLFVISVLIQCLVLGGRIMIQNDLSRSLKTPKFYGQDSAGGITWSPEEIRPGESEVIILDDGDLLYENTEIQGLVTFNIEGRYSRLSVGWHIPSLDSVAGNHNRIGVYYGLEQNETKILENLLSESPLPGFTQAKKATSGWQKQICSDRTEIAYFMSSDDDNNIMVHLYDSNQLPEGIYYIQTSRSSLYLGKYFSKVTLDTEGNDQNDYLFKWKITQRGNQNYLIQTVDGSGLAWKASGSSLQLALLIPGADFEWSIQRVSGDLFSIQNSEPSNRNYLDSKSCADSFECTVDSTMMLFPFNNRSTEGDATFRLIPAPEKMDFLENDYYYLLATETNQDLKLTSWTDFAQNSSGLMRTIRTSNPTADQSWLIREVLVSDKKGYIIMNKKYNMALTKSSTSTEVDGKPLNPNLPGAPLNSEHPLYQLWDIQFQQGDYAEIAYTIRNLFCASGCYLDLQDFKVKDTPMPFVLSRLDKYSPPVFGLGSSIYSISVASTPQFYVVETYSTSKIYGSSITGENNQKWQVKTTSQSANDIWYLMTLYKYPAPNENKNYYLTNLNGSPKSVAGGQPEIQSWKIEQDSTFYNLYYKISYSNLYLTAPLNKNQDADFSLQAANSERLRDQRFMLISEELLSTITPISS